MRKYLRGRVLHLFSLLAAGLLLLSLVHCTGTLVTSSDGLTHEQYNRLATLGAPGPIPVAVPDYVPDGFSVDSVHIPQSNVLDYLLGYMIRYKAPNGACFVIESKTGVIPAIDTQMYRQPELSEQHRHPVNPPIFSNTTGDDYYIYRTGENSVQSVPAHSVFSSWFQSGPHYYHFRSGHNIAKDCKPVSMSLAARIVKSLQWLPGTEPSKNRIDPFDFTLIKAFLQTFPKYRCGILMSPTPGGELCMYLPRTV